MNPDNRSIPEDVVVRPIEPGDNDILANIIRRTLAEFVANHPGTVYYDPTTDTLYELFRKPRSAYFVVEHHGKIAGGGGIYPTDGLPADTCELVKMYLLPEARGKGLGRAMIERCISEARNQGFSRIYLETMPELSQALHENEKLGFSYLTRPLGNSGHLSLLPI